MQFANNAPAAVFGVQNAMEWAGSIGDISLRNSANRLSQHLVRGYAQVCRTV